MSDEKKVIKIENGKGENLNISPVYEHIKPNNPQYENNHNKNIIIPKSKK